MRDHRIHRRAQALDVLLDGLGQLEYRGYDSTGVCLSAHAGLHRLRAADNLAALAAARRRAGPPPRRRPASGTPAGPPTAQVSVANTHPFRRLRPRARSPSPSTASSRTSPSCAPSSTGRGHRFESSTDAEVVVHLLEEHADLEPHAALARWRRPARRPLRHRRPRQPAPRRPGRHPAPGPAGGRRRRGRALPGLHRGRRAGPDPALRPARGRRRRRPRRRHLVRLRPAGRRPVAARRSPSSARPRRADHDGLGSFLAKEIAEQPGAVADTLARPGRRHRRPPGRARRPARATRPTTPSPTRWTRSTTWCIVGCGTALHAGHGGPPDVRAVGRAPHRGGRGQRVALRLPDRGRIHAGRGHVPVGGDRRHPGRRPAGPFARAPRTHRDHQHARLPAHPGGRPRPSSPGPGSR